MTSSNLRKFPVEIFELKNLFSLNLNGAQNMELDIPDRFHEIPGLKFLYLNLGGFKLNQGKFYNMPKSFYELKNLEHVNFTNSRIKLPSVPTVNNLAQVYAYGTYLTQLPDGILSLPNSDLMFAQNNIDTLSVAEYDLFSLANKSLDNQHVYGNVGLINLGQAINVSDASVFATLSQKYSQNAVDYQIIIS